MAIRSTDLFMYKAFKTAIEDIRRNEYIMEDIVGDAAADPLLSEVYGQKEIDKFKKFMKNEIHVDVHFNIDMAKLPAIAISIGGGSEDTSRVGDALGDGYLTEDVDPGTLSGNFRSPQIVLGPVTPISYDKLTGKVTFPSNISLANVFDGMVMYDEKNKVSYSIEVVLDDSNLLIEAGSEPDFTGATIRASKNAVRHTHKSFFCYEEVTLTPMATSTAELIYLYDLILYIIGRYRMSLFDSKNFKASTITYGPIFKQIDDPNQIFAREIVLRGQVEHSYIERTDALLQGSKPDVRIDSMPKTPSGLAKQAKDQGWRSPEDD